MPKTIAIALTSAVVAAISAGLLSQPDFDEMAAEVDRVRSTQADIPEVPFAPGADTKAAMERIGITPSDALACEMRTTAATFAQAVCTLQGNRVVLFNKNDSGKISAELPVKSK